MTGKMASVKITREDETRPLLSPCTEPKTAVHRPALAIVAVLGTALLCSLVLLGGSFKTNAYLKQRLTGCDMLCVSQVFR
jgi:hypothetical protein